MARVGKGTTLAYADTHNAASPTVLVELKQAPMPQTSSGMVDDDVLDGDWDQRLPDGTKRLGDLSVSANWTPAQFETMRGFVGLEKWWTLTFPNGAKYVFEAVVLDNGGGAITRKGIIEHTFTLAPTGNIIPSSSPASPIAYTAGT